MKKLDYGIKISKRGFNVIDLNQERRNSSTTSSPPHLVYALALPYLQGAKIQVKRYQIAASTLEKRPSGGVIDCIHEASTLFEDLCTVSKYAERCGNIHKHHKLWLDVRNHIRHDIREELDNDDNSRKNGRATRLRLDPKLQTSIGFSLDLIKVGETEIKINEIVEYLDWADKVIAKVMNEAKDKGQIQNFRRSRTR